MRKPKIRFKNYNDDYIANKLGDCCNIFAGGTPSTEISEYRENGTINRLPSGNIQDCYIYENDITTKISEKGLQHSSAKLIRPNTTLLAMTGATCGKTGYLTCQSSANQSVMAFETTKLNSKYLFYTFQKNKNLILKNQAGGAQAGINKETCSNFVFFFPDDIEQKNVSNLFSSIDSQIELNKHQIENLKNLKKNFLQKMFPKDGENIPQLRFKGFTNEWEEKGMDKITFFSGTKNKDNLPFRSYSITNKLGFVPQDEHFEGGNLANADKSMYYIVEPNSFAYNPARINVGSIGYRSGNENVIVSSLYEVFKTTNEIDDRFLMYRFKRDMFQNLIKKYQEGGVRSYFYYDKLCLCKIHIPTIDEQKKIGLFLENLDNQINRQTARVEKLKNLKQSLLEKMFI